MHFDKKDIEIYLQGVWAAIDAEKYQFAAIALSALTKTSPRIAMPVAPGTAIPRIAPRISPTRIRFTRAMSVHLFQSFFIFLLL